MASIRSTSQVLDKSPGGNALHMGFITRLYPDAMELCGTRSYGSPAPILALAIIFIFFFNYYNIEDFEGLIHGMKKGYGYAYINFIADILISCTIIFPIAYFVLFSPGESPIIFDRKHQKVYWVSRRNNWRRFLLRPAVVRSYDWGQVQAEHQTSPMAMGNVISRMHHLTFIVRDANGNLADEYPISPVTGLVTSLNAYINAYMLGQVQPGARDIFFGNNLVYGYKYILSNDFPLLHWSLLPGRLKKKPVATLCTGLAMPLFMVWTPVYLFTKFLADITRQRLLWPQAILSALGPATEASASASGLGSNPDIPQPRFEREALPESTPTPTAAPVPPPERGKH